MSRTYNIFISWSGNRSMWVADALRNWLPIVIQAARPWMSQTDIRKGARGFDELAQALNTIKVGICCLTPENLKAPWILYEAGALSKTMGDKTRLCPYLAGGLRYEDVELPLGMFQATKAEKEDTRRMVSGINAAISDDPVPASDLDEIFEAMWPKLEQKLKSMPDAEEETAATDSFERGLSGIDYRKASIGLTAYCLAVRNDLAAEVQEKLAAEVQRLDDLPVEDPIKVRILGVYLRRVVGRDVFDAALRELRVHLKAAPH